MIMLSDYYIDGLHLHEYPHVQMWVDAIYIGMYISSSAFNAMDAATFSMSSDTIFL